MARGGNSQRPFDLIRSCSMTSLGINLFFRLSLFLETGESFVFLSSGLFLFIFKRSFQLLLSVVGHEGTIKAVESVGHDVI